MFPMVNKLFFHSLAQEGQSLIKAFFERDKSRLCPLLIPILLILMYIGLSQASHNGLITECVIGEATAADYRESGPCF